MGLSYQFRSPVEPFIKAAVVNSLKLAALAFVIVVPLSILAGIVAALRVGPGQRPGHLRGRAVGRPPCPSSCPASCSS